jgi:hypothetical protein
LAAGAPASAATWDHPHGNAANTGFADVATVPAAAPMQSVPGIGPVAPGAGPVIGPDGTVYLGNFAGELRAIRPDGSQAWMRTLLRGQHIIASPVIGGDGSIYVVGATKVIVRDHRGGDPVGKTIYDSTVYRFSPGGAMVWASSFPDTNPAEWGNATAPAAPNIWRSGETEVIVVPAVFPTYGGHDVRLAAYSAGGALLSNQLVTSVRYEVTGGQGDIDWICWTGFCTPPRPGPAPDPFDVVLAQLRSPLPAVGIVARGGDPAVVVADGYQNVVGYAFSLATGFQETFRKHLTNDTRGILMSSPAVLRDGHTALSAWKRPEDGIADQAWLLFAGPHPIDISEVVLPELTTVNPTLTAEGRIVTLGRSGVTATQTYPRMEIALIAPLDLGGRLAPAAASRNHLFVSTESAFLTLDASSLQVVARFGWQTRFRSSPAIGADGRVYAIAGDTLFVFPAPPRCPRRVCPGDVTPGGGPVFHSEQGTPAQGAVQVQATTPPSIGVPSQPGAVPK